MQPGTGGELYSTEYTLPVKNVFVIYVRLLASIAVAPTPPPTNTTTTLAECCRPLFFSIYGSALTQTCSFQFTHYHKSPTLTLGSRGVCVVSRFDGRS